VCHDFYFETVGEREWYVDLFCLFVFCFFSFPAHVLFSFWLTQPIPPGDLPIKEMVEKILADGEFSEQRSNKMDQDDFLR
jgi:hypothetical protein